MADASIVSPIGQIDAPTRPFDGGAVLRRIVAILQRRGFPIALAALLVMGGGRMLGNDLLASMRHTAASHFVLALAGYGVTLALIVVSSLYSAWVTQLAVDDARGRADGLRLDGVGHVLEQLGPIALSTLLNYLGTFLGAVLLAVPGIMLAMAWSVYVPVLAIERTGPVEALRRSAKLTKGHRWTIFWFAVAWIVVIIVAEVAVTALTFRGYSFLNALRTRNYVRYVAPAMAAFSRLGYAVGSAALYIELARINETSDTETVARVFA